MKVENIVKQDQIVQAALRRFAHFGITKTNLTEVAEDLIISKQMLSYYFHDKKALVSAVIEKLSDDYFDMLKSQMETSHTVEEGLQKLTDVKAIFFEKYFLLALDAEQIEIVRNEQCRSWRKIMTDKEAGLITKLFDSGVQSEELKPLDTGKTAELLLDTLFAFTRSVKNKGGIPDKEAFDNILKKQREVISLFYQGLKAESWVN